MYSGMDAVLCGSVRKVSTAESMSSLVGRHLEGAGFEFYDQSQSRTF